VVRVPALPHLHVRVPVLLPLRMEARRKQVLQECEPHIQILLLAVMRRPNMYLTVLLSFSEPSHLPPQEQKMDPL
jgi:hypothetical protein